MTITKHIEFEDFTIETTITKNANGVAEWIAELENSDNLKINKLNKGSESWLVLTPVGAPLGQESCRSYSLWVDNGRCQKSPGVRVFPPIYTFCGNIGLDTEWTPSKGGENPIAILQVCVGFKCLIFQVNFSPEIPGSLITFFNNPEYTFTGVEIKNDFKKLKYKRAFLERNMQDFGSKILDVRELAIQMKCFNVTKDFGLMKLANTVLKNELKSEIKKDKDATISNWHIEDLSLDQVKYATLDAYLSFRIGQVLLEKSKNDSRV